MCGIIGVLNHNQVPVEEKALYQMLGMIRHRGPDQFGVYLDDDIGLGSARLSIIDLSSGQQPISNEDESLWIVFNGEIFNYVELRPELEQRGHRFSTTTDTEVILHLYEDFGPDCLSRLNGQFAIAIWDTRKQTLFLARDRLGIRPLFYTRTESSFLFGSEIKSLLANRRVSAELDPVALDQIFTFWSTLSPRTVFKNIFEIPPGHYMLLKAGHEPAMTRYWQLQFPSEEETNHFSPSNRQAVEGYREAFRDLLIDATQIRLRADVPVGAYLSGGLDSSTTAAIIRNFTSNRLDTFSIAFSDPDYDESVYQYRMADYLGTDHQVIHADYADVGQAFIDSIWHIETPILRTSPAPLYLLSKLVNDANYKVVLTGEGADEFLAGYNIFKESQVRRFWARQPDSQMRPLLIQKLYPYIGSLSGPGGAYTRSFFSYALTDTDRPDYSHMVRWRNTARIKRFFSEDFAQAMEAQSPSGHTIPYPEEFKNWHTLSQAQYLEISIFLSQYLLSSQGDRVAMAHSVEGRFPFLDYRVVEFNNQLPEKLKLYGLNEKFLLKQVAKEWLPDEIWQRPKRPYRAPIQRSFFNSGLEETVSELLSPENISQSGVFKFAAVQKLIEKARTQTHLSETDEMALAGILSTELVIEYFMQNFSHSKPVGNSDDLKICDRRRAKTAELGN